MLIIFFCVIYHLTNSIFFLLNLDCSVCLCVYIYIYIYIYIYTCTYFMSVSCTYVLQRD